MRWLRFGLLWCLFACHAWAAADDSNPRVLIRTSAGDFKIELFPNKAPLTVANFLQYMESGFYNDTVFHRVIPNFMIQGGGFTAKMAEKPTLAPVANESRNRLHNERGTIAMARTDDPDSASSQWFINVRSNLRLDYNYVLRKPGYTVFGRVTEGMDVVDGISLVDTAVVAGHDDVPLYPIVVHSIERIK
jgi:cyclophilin family peptidyl-prolyl cis-trans isomerase